MGIDFQDLHQRRIPGGYRLQVSKFSINNRPSIDALVCQDGFEEPECRVTVNLVDHPLNHDEFHVKLRTREMSPQVFDALISEGIAHPTGQIVSAGFVERYAEVWKLGRQPATSIA